jgi:hypothetical protein
MIVEIKPSPLKNKRLRVYLTNGKTYDFGFKGGSTYIDHHNEQLRLNYIKRHGGNVKEAYLIHNLIPSPALFSMYLLWGKSTDLNENVKYLNEKFSEKEYKFSKLKN